MRKLDYIAFRMNDTYTPGNVLADEGWRPSPARVYADEGRRPRVPSAEAR
jgi:hypothetical protein